MQNRSERERERDLVKLGRAEILPPTFASFSRYSLNSISQFTTLMLFPFDTVKRSHICNEDQKKKPSNDYLGRFCNFPK